MNDADVAAVNDDDDLATLHWVVSCAALDPFTKGKPALDRLAARLQEAERERDELKQRNHERLVSAWDDLASLRDQLQGRFEQIAELHERAEAAELRVAALEDVLDRLRYFDSCFCAQRSEANTERYVHTYVCDAARALLAGDGAE